MTTSNKTLICWLGGNDIKAIDGNNIGPILATLQKVTFDTLYLLNSYSENIAINYTEWLRTKINIDINLVNEELSSPTDFKDIYLAAHKNLDLW